MGHIRFYLGSIIDISQETFLVTWYIPDRYREYHDTQFTDLVCVTKVLPSPKA